MANPIDELFARERPDVRERARAEANEILREIGESRRTVIKASDLSEIEMNLIMNVQPAKGSEQYDHEVTDAEHESRNRKS